MSAECTPTLRGLASRSAVQRDVGRSSTPIWTASSTWRPERHAGRPPLFDTGGANDTYDVAVFLLDEPLDLPLSPLPDLGLLDTKAAKRARYTAVGYGTVRSSKSAGSNSLGLGRRREYASQSVNSATKSWITFSMNPSTGSAGTCYGDSGGPHFDADGVVVSLTVTGDRYCRSTDKTYRLDTTDAQDFLAPYLD